MCTNNNCRCDCDDCRNVAPPPDLRSHLLRHRARQQELRASRTRKGVTPGLTREEKDARLAAAGLSEPMEV
jgi:hypothetical protein